MKTYQNQDFVLLLENMVSNKLSRIKTTLESDEMVLLKYFLTYKHYYAVIIDDYPHMISDKASLLEALFYQLQLVTVYDLNWDAIEEGLNDLFNSSMDYEGICLLFKNTHRISESLKKELGVLGQIMERLNSHGNGKKMVTFMGKG